ncbi:hypothetical protein Tco_0088537 [Tanacetum coccineum]
MLSLSRTYHLDLHPLNLFLIPILSGSVKSWTVTTQAAEIKSLKAQVKKLKKQARPFILHHEAWLRTVKRKNQNKKNLLKTSKRRSDDLDMDIDDIMDYTLAQDEGKTDKVDEKGEKSRREREQFTVEERAKFLHNTIATQRRILAQQRSEAIRNKPPIKNQFRNQMMTYLKHVGNKKHADLKTKSFDEIKALYDKCSRHRTKNRKRLSHMKMIARKRKRPQPDVDSDDEHRKCLKIVTFEGTIDSEIMETKSFISKLDKVSSPEGDLHVSTSPWKFHVISKLMRRIAKDVKENFQVRSELSECLNTSSMKVKRIYNEETEVKQDPQSCLGKIVL